MYLLIYVSVVEFYLLLLSVFSLLSVSLFLLHTTFTITFQRALIKFNPNSSRISSLTVSNEFYLCCKRSNATKVYLKLLWKIFGHVTIFSSFLYPFYFLYVFKEIRITLIFGSLFLMLAICHSKDTWKVIFCCKLRKWGWKFICVWK